LTEEQQQQQHCSAAAALPEQQQQVPKCTVISAESQQTLALCRRRFEFWSAQGCNLMQNARWPCKRHRNAECVDTVHDDGSFRDHPTNRCWPSNRSLLIVHHVTIERR
jgi:hypothetical protein